MSKRNEPGIQYCRVRKVKPLERANIGDAGLDFFCPEDLTIEDFIKANESAKGILENRELEVGIMGEEGFYNPLSINGLFGPLTIITKVRIQPLGRVLIPSGIKVLLSPRKSMLQANNKSGVSTKKGLIFGAEVVDSPYTGEIHISLINVSKHTIEISAGEKLVQFVHVPVYQTIPNEIDPKLYEQISYHWGTRGSSGFGGSGDGLDIDEELNLRDAHGL